MNYRTIGAMIVAALGDAPKTVENFAGMFAFHEKVTPDHVQDVLEDLERVGAVDAVDVGPLGPQTPPAFSPSDRESSPIVWGYYAPHRPACASCGWANCDGHEGGE